MRGTDANLIVESWELAHGEITLHDARYVLVDSIAKAIEAAYREGVETGTRCEKDRLRKVLGL